MTLISVTLPIRTVSEANVRECWQVKHRRAKEQRFAARTLLVRHLLCGKSSHIVVTLTRIGKRMLDTDNLARSNKAVRDGIADALGIDDGSDRIEWRYAQEKGEYAVRVEIEETRNG